MARPNKYLTNVQPYLKEISLMALEMTEEQMCNELKIAVGTFCEYKKRYPELNEALKKGRRKLAYDLKGNLVRAAKGYFYSEKKIIKERNPETGEMEIVREEIQEKYMKPDVAANNLLLKNYDREFWRNDPADYELKKRAVELQEEKMEQLGEWT